MSEVDELLKSFGLAFLIFVVIASIFEVILLGVAFFGADKVECNWLWCTFTTERGEGTFTQTTYSECYQNGVEVNCTDMPNIDNFIEDKIKAGVQD